MKPGLFARAALAAALLLWASPATAQLTRPDQLSEAQEDEIYCLHDELIAESEPFYLAVEAFLYGTHADEAEAAVRKAAEACAATYKWDAAEQSLAVRAGLASATFSYLVEELYADGATDEQVHGIERVMLKLSDADLSRFLDDSWLEDAAFIKRINTLLVAEKFPGDEGDTLGSARLVIEAFVAETAATREWVRTYVNKKS